MEKLALWLVTNWDTVTLIVTNVLALITKPIQEWKK